jgi:hypothetical protein
MPVLSEFATETAHVVVMKKTADVLSLRDVLTHFKGRIDERHVAWMMSALLNIACYWQYAGIAHNAVSLDTCFISPKHHTVLVLGGWWYSRPIGGKMIAAPSHTINYAPHDLLTKKVADIRTDLEMIKALGRQLLGDVTGMRLASDKSVPQPMARWLKQAASDNAVDEYRIWKKKILHDSFDDRRFVELAVTSNDIY